MGETEGAYGCAVPIGPTPIP